MENSTEIKEVSGKEVTFFIPNTESIGKLQELDTKFKLTMSYKKQEDWIKIENQPVRAFYMGLKEIPNEHGEMINCAVFTTEKECFICGQMVILDAVRNLKPTTQENQTAVQITYLGKKKNKNSDGSTNIFDVQILG